MNSILKKLEKKKLNILQIGFYESAISLKLVKQLSNKDSKLYLLNSWTNFLEKDKMTEEGFLKDLEETGYGKQIINLKMLSNQGLIYLKSKKVKFDLIMIDTEHETKNLLSNIYLSWLILKNGGNIILYKNDISNMNMKDVKKLFGDKIKTRKMKNDMILEKK